MPQDEELPHPSSEAAGRRKIVWDRVLNFSVGFLAVVFLYVVGPFGHTRSYELARRAMCGSNLLEVGKAIAAYQDEYGGRMPPDLDHRSTTPGPRTSRPLRSGGRTPGRT